MLASGPPSPQDLSVILAVATIFHVLALVLTSFRLWFRSHRRRLWWDDFWAALALLCVAVCIVTVWLYHTPLDEPNAKFDGLPSIRAQSRRTHIVSFWLGMLLITCGLWFARISIVFSVVRIVPPCRNTTMMIFGAAGVLICMWIYILACKVVICSVNDSWYHSTTIDCNLPRWVALSEVCTDVLSDVILVILPLHLLWRVKLPLNQKIMVLSIFSTSILVTVVGVVHTVYLLSQVSYIKGITTQIEGAVSVIVCNLLVIVTFLYRMTTNGGDLTDGLPCGNTCSSNRLTTVELEVSGGSLFTSAGACTGTGSNWTGHSGSTGLTGTYVSSVAFANIHDKGIPSDSTIGTDSPVSAPLVQTARSGVSPSQNTKPQ